MRFEPLQITESRPVLGQRDPYGSSLSSPRHPAGSRPTAALPASRTPYTTRPINGSRAAGGVHLGHGEHHQGQTQTGKHLGLTPVSTLEEVARNAIAVTREPRLA